MLISGSREDARKIVDDCLVSGASAEAIIEKLFHPTLEMIQKLYRADQMSVLSHHYATRLLRMLTDQMQMRLETQESRGKKVLLLCGPTEPDELAGQMAADMLEADGYETYFGGGGVANDEIVSEIGEMNPDVLVLYGSTPSDLPHIRMLIDNLRDMGMSRDLQIVVGGGVFNRAEGLAEEIGADLWASSPAELVSEMRDKAERRMDDAQRTVGRRRRQARLAA
jgi:methanogenic corrinoid protein MtbC1